MTLPHTAIDLRSSLPAGWELSGLSEPKWDGNNYYRVVIESQASFNYTLREDAFLQLNYQAYSPNSNIRVKSLIDGKYAETSYHPKLEFVTHNLSDTFLAGKHRINLFLTCDDRPCPPSSVRLYELRGEQTGFLKKPTLVGWNNIKYSLLSPDHPFSISGGLSRVMTDGNTLISLLESNAHISNRSLDNVALLTSTFFSDQSAKITLTNNKYSLYNFSLKPGEFKAIAVNLRGVKGGINLNLTCEKTPCSPVRMYSPQIMLEKPHATFNRLTTETKIYLALLPLLLIFILAFLLGFLPRKR